MSRSLRPESPVGWTEKSNQGPVELENNKWHAACSHITHRNLLARTEDQISSNLSNLSAKVIIAAAQKVADLQSYS